MLHVHVISHAYHITAVTVPQHNGLHVQVVSVQQIAHAVMVAICCCSPQSLSATTGTQARTSSCQVHIMWAFSEENLHSEF